jgi:uncharacterized membrane protein YjfL (UPF0719 family)
MIPLLALLPPGFGTSVTMAAIYAVLGVLLMAAGFWIFDLLTPGSLQKEIFVHRNVAAGVLAAGVMVAIGIVIYASFL